MTTQTQEGSAMHQIIAILKGHMTTMLMYETRRSEREKKAVEVAEDPWWRAFSAKHQNLQLWVCVRAWRFMVLRKKRRYLQLTSQEQLEIDFFERGLPLHAVVAFTNAADWRFDWVQLLSEWIPEALEASDSGLRVPLYYAFENRWHNYEELSWLIAKSQRVLLRKDNEGRTLIAHAVTYNCPQVVVMMMAVEYAQTTLRSLESIVQNRQFESGRRLCIQMVNGYFAGVPHFPLASSLQLLREHDALGVVNGMQLIWREFADKWGYYGTPLITDDLSLVRHAPLDSFFQIIIRARGEPLSYQWYRDDEAITGATQASLVVSHCLQPIDEGVYHCEVVNWKGRVSSTKMKLSVVDDRHGPDPSLRFLFTTEDKRIVLGKADCEIYRVTASRGALLFASLPLSHPKSMTGCSLLVPPKCFQSFDKSGNDVSDTVGMEIAIRVCTPTEGVCPKLTRTENLLSPVVEVLPFTVPTLLQPAILTIPHAWVSGSDKFHELTIVELTIGKPPSHREGYAEVPSSRLISSDLKGGVSFEISRFGRYALVSRSLATVNRESEAPLEEVVICVTHPRQLLSSAIYSVPNSRKPIVLSVWLALNRPDSIDFLDHEVKRTSKNRDIAMSTMSVRIRQNQQLHFRVGSKAAFMHVWRGNIDELLSQSHSSLAGVFSVCDDYAIKLGDLGLDPHGSSRHDDAGFQIDVFRVIEIEVAIKKPSLYQVTGKRNDARADGLLLMEKHWSIPIPMKHDIVHTPPKPVLHQRLQKQFAIAFPQQYSSESLVSRSGGEMLQSIRLFEDVHEMEREFTPYFYAVEFARFSSTFWQRYDKTWWFDKTKSNILEGMFKLVHAGTEPFSVISSDAYAGTVRVVQCSIDTVGVYSEPLLLEPRDNSTDNDLASQSTDQVDDDLDESTSAPSSLRRVLTLPASFDLSPQTHASIERMRVLLDTIYCLPQMQVLVGESGVDLESLRSLLERRRAHSRAINCDVALLNFVMERVSHFIQARIFLRSSFYGALWSKLALLHRLLPEIDCFPMEYGITLTKLHTIVRDFFVIIHKRASKGWLSRLVQDDWDESACEELVARTARMLRNEAAPLHGAADLLSHFEYNEGDTCTIVNDKFAVRQVREFVLLTINRPQAHDHRSLAMLLFKFLPSPLAMELVTADWEDHVQSELQSDSLKRALNQIHETDTLTNHIRSISPADQDRVPSSMIPPSISVQFDLHIVHVDTQHVIKVTNCSLRCGVQGITTFEKEQKRLVFTPSIPCDRHTRYQATLRAQYVHTVLGGPLRESTTVGFEFIIA